MRRTVVIPVPTAGTTKAYTLDRDCTLIAACASLSGANFMVVSSDPALTGAEILAAPAATRGVLTDCLTMIVPNSSGFAQNLQIPLSKDSTIYVNSSQAAWCFLLFEDPLSAQNPVT